MKQTDIAFWDGFICGAIAMCCFFLIYTIVWC